jgi:hypothetical protein
MWNSLVLWNCIFNSCNLGKFCNLARRRCKLCDGNMKMSKHVAVYVIGLHCCDIHCCDIHCCYINCAFVVCNTNLKPPEQIFVLNGGFCRSCGGKDETSAHVLCECEALTSPRHTHLGSFFLDPEGIKSLSVGAIWNSTKGKRRPWPCIRLWGTKDLSKGLGASGPKGLEPNL